MTIFEERGAAIRMTAKALIIDFLEHHTDARPEGHGIKQASIFRDCGLDWGEYPQARSSNQQYWTIAILKQLEKEGFIVQVSPSGPWRRVR
jgi:hypothetical protein